VPEEAKHADAHSRMVWSHPSIKSSWYRSREGRVIVLSPWRLLGYWRWTKQPQLEDLTLE
jgi:4-hydroxyacetophenone monooxygenase